MKKVFVCAGHRGTGTGAKGFIDEGAEVISLRNEIVKQLQVQGIQVVVDNNADGLSSVVNTINSCADINDIVVDLHFNAFNGKASGTEVLIPNYASAIEQQLADELVDNICATLGTKNRGVKKEGSGQHSRLAMLSGIKANSVLIEVCFCDNKKDSDNYKQNKTKLIQMISKILVKFAKS